MHNKKLTKGIMQYDRSCENRHAVRDFHFKESRGRAALKHRK